jgi:hypothetical protein
LKRILKAACAPILLAVVLAGCKFSNAEAATADAETAAPSGTAAPTAPPPPPPNVPLPTGAVDSVVSLMGAAAISSNFDYQTTLQIAWGSGAIPKSGVPDIVGAFRFICGAGQLSYDDPIVYPGQPGKAHLHQFYGNLAADGNSTFKSLRENGDSTCNSSGTQDGTGAAANRSAYWMPAMLDGKGNVVKPNYVVIYYKRLPDSDSRCHPESNPAAWGRCITVPNGLRFIFGYDMITGKPPTGDQYFNCKDGTAGIYNSIPAAAPNCPPGSKLLAIIQAPECWDGKNLDSPNHRDHVSYRQKSDGKCPTTHPFLMPRFTLTADYSVLEGDDLMRWKLSSDEMHPELPAGSTYHADYFEAWDPFVKAMWTDHCINKLLSCSGGDLGNGKQLKNAAIPVYKGVKSWTIPTDMRLVPIPPASATP